MTVSRDKIAKICATYFLCWTFIPPMQVGNIYRLIAVCCAVTWFILSVGKVYLHENEWYVFWAIFSTIGMILLRVVVFNSGRYAIINTLQWIIMLLVGIIVLYYLKYDIEYLYVLYTVILVIVAIFAITTIKADLLNPYSSRIANSEWLEARFEGNENVGLYGYVYMAVFIEPCLIFLKKNRIRLNKIFDVMVWIDILLIAIMIAVAGYSLAIVCSLISCFIVIVFDTQRPFRSILILAILFVVFLNYKKILDGVFDFLLQIVDTNVVYQGKLTEFREFFLEGSASGNLSDRLKNYSGSLDGIIHYPIFGTYFSGVAGGGGHSFILDSIGKFGWFIGAVDIYLILIKPFRMSRYKKKNILDTGLFISFLLFLVADPLSQEIAIALFLIFPGTQKLVNGKKKKIAQM